MRLIKFDLKLICREPLGTLHYLEWRFDCVNLKRGILERIAPAPPLNGGGRGRTCISSLQASLGDQLLLFLVPFVTYHRLLSATEARKLGRQGERGLRSSCMDLRLQPQSHLSVCARAHTPFHACMAPARRNYQ